MIFRKHGESIHDYYYISGIIGHPYDSKTRLAVHKQSGLERAIKEIPKDQIPHLDESFYARVKHLGTLDHPNISKYLEFYED